MTRGSQGRCLHCHGTAGVIDVSGACQACAHQIRHKQWRAVLWLGMSVLVLVFTIGLMAPSTAQTQGQTRAAWGEILAELDREIGQLAEQARAESALRQELNQERDRLLQPVEGETRAEEFERRGKARLLMEANFESVTRSNQLRDLLSEAHGLRHAFLEATASWCEYDPVAQTLALERSQRNYHNSTHPGEYRAAVQNFLAMAPGPSEEDCRVIAERFFGSF